ncbi:hypothetical protein PVK06_038956 [Gossypium arboreum]|uniref:Uncharacterized protein n=1 Tax=Gossypium arboreum TaxID=29729 RepID=A0ABR0N1I5_GOSAR|nr:hypothetical protein PVK06_038956 [Gossypium arboreum]
MVPEDPHFSFAVWGVYHHSRGCCTATRAPNQQECGNRCKCNLGTDCFLL